MKLEKYKIWGYVIILVLACVLEFSIFSYLDSAQASSDPEVSVCVEVAKTPVHKIYRCEDEELNKIFYMNNLGLPMIPVEN